MLGNKLPELPEFSNDSDEEDQIPLVLEIVRLPYALINRSLQVFSQRHL